MKDIYRKMNSQNIFKYYGSRLDLRLDSSEFYDYELAKVDTDFDSQVIDFTTLITYTSRKINLSMDGFDIFPNTTITLEEYDNSVNDPDYVFSGLSVTYDYTGFTSELGESILNSHLYSYTGFTGETHYFTIDGYDNPLDETIPLTGFSSTILSCSAILDDSTGSCCTQPPNFNYKPVYYGIGEPYCSPIIRPRTEKGWTLDFVFNRESLPWSSGSTFYYWGVMNEEDEDYYLDNNLSFSFTNDGRIKWESYRYSGYCDTVSGYTGTSYLSTGQTSVLCSGGTSNDFNITITFERNNTLDVCDLVNGSGGLGSLITGVTILNPLNVITGATPNTVSIETLNSHWNRQRDLRLGTLKIYLNGRPIYKLKDWEEIIPSRRGSFNPLSQIWGGGTGGSENIHTGVTYFNLKQVQYFEEPLNFVNVRHNYLSAIKPNFSVSECDSPCVDTALMGYTDVGILDEDNNIFITEDDDIITY